MRINENITSLFPSSNLKTNSGSKNVVAKVYGIVMNQNTPSRELFLKAGGWAGLGSIFYIEYEQSTNIDQIDLKTCKIAKPLFSNQKQYPVIGELVLLMDLPGAATQLIDDISETYYVTTINIWNNSHHNAQPSSDNHTFGKTFQEKSNINMLQPFEGDYILEGRFGNTIRFGSTVKDPNVSNPWSVTGDEGSPLLILSNGHNFDPKNTLPYVEDINRDGSTIVLSSTQTIPINASKIKLNTLTKPISVDKYSDAQIILNANRVVINSKKDDVFIIGNSNIELYTKNIINLNSEDRIHFNSPRVFLGTANDGTLPDEPLILGDKLVTWLDNLCKELSSFCSVLSRAVSTPEGTPLLEINTAAQLLGGKIQDLVSQTDDLKSQQNYTL